MIERGGGSVGDYRAPLFVAWQLTNACSGRCLHCCEASGSAWRDELSALQAMRLARDIASSGVVECAFGGGEPLSVPHVWELFDVLHAGSVALKIETDGLAIDDASADRLRALDVECIQISIDGATAATHARLRPGGSFRRACAAVERLAVRGLGPELVFVPTRLNAHEAVAAYELAASLGARRFVTGPLMRLGRAHEAWGALALDGDGWRRVTDGLASVSSVSSMPELVVYPHDIVEEVRQRVSSPQAMALIVPNGHAKLLNALPFSYADLRTSTIQAAWQVYASAWRHPRVVGFCASLARDPSLLRHANEVWPV